MPHDAGDGSLPLDLGAEQTRPADGTPSDVTLTWHPEQEAPQQACNVPRVLGSIRLGDEIGRGNMGIVYHGWDDVLRRAVAVKFLIGAVPEEGDPRFEQFLSGARAEAAVRHPNIVPVHAAGLVQDMPYVVMDYVDGPSLRCVSKAVGPMSLAAAIRIISDVTNAVGALHDHGFVHRDLKPANILFDTDANVHVTDFGLAALKRRGRGEIKTAGTPAYMSPEAFQGKASPQVDVYALAILLFELLTGCPPFRGELATVRHRHLHDPLPLAALEKTAPAELIEVIERAAHKNEVFRYRSASHLQRAIEDAVDTTELLRTGQTEVKALAAAALADSTPAPRPDPTPQSPPTSYFDRITQIAERKRRRAPEEEQAHATEPAWPGSTAGDEAQPDAEEPPSAPGRVSFLQHREYILRQLLLLAGAAAVLVLVAGIVGLAAALLDGGRYQTGLLAGAVALYAVLALAWWAGRRWLQRRVRAIALAGVDRPARDVVHDVLHSTDWFLGSGAADALLETLVAQRRYGEAFCIWPGSEPRLPRQLPADLPPQPLDRLIGLMTDDPEPPAPEHAIPTQPPPSSHAEDSPEGLMRKFRRHVAPRAGWWIVTLFWTVGLAVACWLLHGTTGALPSAGVFVVGAAAMLLYAPLRRPFWKSHWILLPGGIGLCETQWRQNGQEARLFDPQESLICVYNTGGTRWHFIAADADGTRHADITEQEADLMLACWIAPGPPPSPDCLCRMAMEQAHTTQPPEDRP